MNPHCPLSKPMTVLLTENEALCRQLAKLQARASELLQQRAAEIEQLNCAIDFLKSELNQRDAMITFLQTKLHAFRCVPAERPVRQLVCK
jgi:predicted RNase H-like nuclease (RuvC/YqgF family)